MASIDVPGALAYVRKPELPLSRGMAGRRKLIAPKPASATETATQP